MNYIDKLLALHNTELEVVALSDGVKRINQLNEDNSYVQVRCKKTGDKSNTVLIISYRLFDENTPVVKKGETLRLRTNVRFIENSISTNYVFQEVVKPTPSPKA